MQNIETAPRKPRSEFVRILLFLGITIVVQTAAILAGVILCVASIVFLSGLLSYGDMCLVLGISPVLMIFFVGPAAAAACNRILTFRAEGKWWPGPLLMAGLSILYAFLLPRFSWTAMALWLISQYILQRWVLYRKNLDTLCDTSDEKEAANA